MLDALHVVGEVFFRIFFGRRPAEQAKLFVAREDFKYLTIQSEHEGTLTREERQMIHNVVDFRAISARDVMVLMEKVHAISARAPVYDLIARSAAAHIDRWPVLADTGEIVGLVNVLDIALDGRRDGVVESYQRRIVKVAPNEPAHSVLRKLRAARTTLAAVLEAGAKPVGIVTWEALVQRLVDVAGDLCGGRLLLALEGGYDLVALPWSVRRTIEVLRADGATPDPLGPDADARTPAEFESRLAGVKRIHGLD